jgi:hypothetical protein
MFGRTQPAPKGVLANKLAEQKSLSEGFVADKLAKRRRLYAVSSWLPDRRTYPFNKLREGFRCPESYCPHKIFISSRSKGRFRKSVPGSAERADVRLR